MFPKYIKMVKCTQAWGSLLDTLKSIFYFSLPDEPEIDRTGTVTVDRATCQSSHTVKSGLNPGLINSPSGRFISFCLFGSSGCLKHIICIMKKEKPTHTHARTHARSAWTHIYNIFLCRFSLSVAGETIQ